ncbi:MAG: DISARM system helicase DrmA, partial [Vicinamibacteria bacterium]
MGPFAANGEELLPLPPSRWYLTGFLSPQAGREIEDPTAEEAIAAGPELDDEESSGAEPEPKQKHRFPASLGMSVLLPPGSSSDEIVATASYAEYLAESLNNEEEGRKGRLVWRRIPREPVSVPLALDPAKIAKGVSLPGTSGI